MYLDFSNAATADIAERVSATLEKLQGELNAAINPHRLALRQLGATDNLSGVREPYNDDAFKAWYELVRRDANDLETLHHVAIMHHARAIDLESGKEPRGSDADWEAAAKFWLKLWQSDGFWQRITSSIPGAENPSNQAALKSSVEKLREQFPVLFLRIHYSIAFNRKHTKNHRAKYHIKLADSIGFPAKAREMARRETYTEFVKSLPQVVWQTNMLDAGTIKVGTDLIENYLELDPMCLPALEDALRLQIRLIRAWHTDLMALGNDKSADRKAKLDSLRQLAEHWLPYFDKLAEFTVVDDETRQSLGMWYRIVGDVYCGLDLEAKATPLYERGMKSTRPGMDEYQRCRTELGRTHAYLARDRANSKEPNAKAYCDAVAKRDDLDARAHCLLANAYKLLNEFDLAEKVCRIGMTLEQDFASVEDLESAERDKNHLQDMLDNIAKTRVSFGAFQSVQKAIEHLEAQKPELALPLLDQAILADPTSPAAYFHRSQCRMLLNQFDGAQQDLEKFKENDDGSHEKIFSSMEKQIAEGRELARRFGASGLKLRQQAVEAFNRSDFETAASCLRRALQECSQAGRAELSKELAVVLKDWAVRDVNKVMEDEKLSESKKKQICQDALSRLTEACGLDPKNPGASQNLQSLKNMLSNMDAMLEAAKRKAQLIADYGGEEALKAQQRAVEAFNADHHEEAITWLRKGLDLSGGRTKLREELSKVLAMTAIHKVNSAGSSPSSRTLSAAETLLEEAAALDPSNQQAQENLTVLRMIKLRR